MAGTANTNTFMLGTATVSMGLDTGSVFDLGPAQSIGLVKNFTVTSEPSYVELTQGVKNTIVSTVLNKNTVRATMEVYEFTAQNLTYGLGLDGSTVAAKTIATTLASALTNSAVATVASTTGFAVGDMVMLIDSTSDDKVWVRKIASIQAGTSLTFSTNIPASVTIPSGSAVKVVNKVKVGDRSNQPFLNAKVAGVLADGTPVVVLFPKLRLTKGFNMAFSSDNFGNLPFEFAIYDPVTTDPYFSDFPNESAHIYIQK